MTYKLFFYRVKYLCAVQTNIFFFVTLATYIIWYSQATGYRSNQLPGELVVIHYSVYIQSYIYIVCCSKSASRQITQRQEPERNSKDWVPQGVAGEGGSRRGEAKGNWAAWH